jgi:type I restriction enzyme, S subunit
MSDVRPADWMDVTLGQLAKGFRGVSYRPENLMSHASESAVTLLRATNIQKGNLTFDDVQFVPSWLVAPTQILEAGDIAVCMSNGSKALVGKSAPYLRVDKSAYTVGAFCSIFKPVDKAGAEFVFHLFRSQTYQKNIDVVLAGSAINNLKNSSIESAVFKVPVDKKLRQKIATVLTSIDTAIEKTEALIAKYQQIKAGLMHDLFTRGVLPNGQLRPPRDLAPELYQETAMGWIPREWTVQSVDGTLESVADGPFGSNLKTEHYVVDPGARVVRLQNIVEYQYNDKDKVYVSDRHAKFLLRNKVVGGDVLIAGLGEERYPVGRACVYPNELPPAINKADCFRARCNSDVMENKFFMVFLNSELARLQIRRYEQGVTRPRINTGNLKRLAVCVPNIDEQRRIIAKFELMQATIHAQQANVRTLHQQKLGLMQDLLTGKVPVTTIENKQEALV